MISEYLISIVYKTYIINKKKIQCIYLRAHVFKVKRKFRKNVRYQALYNIHNFCLPSHNMGYKHMYFYWNKKSLLSWAQTMKSVWLLGWRMVTYWRAEALLSRYIIPYFSLSVLLTSSVFLILKISFMSNTVLCNSLNRQVYMLRNHLFFNILIGTSNNIPL